ncbi:MAG TPA: PEP-CTERM sorting domain-containing protein [Acidobacteriaceae bacterium]
MRRILISGTIANIRRRCVSAGLLAVACLLVKPALADTVTNGDFETGTLSGWTVFKTSDGSNGTGLPSVVSFDTTGSGASDAAEFNVGEVNFDGKPEGGGLSQTIAAPGSGLYTLMEDFASSDDVGDNSDAGTFSILIDGVTVATDSLGFISSDQILRGSFNKTVTLTAGSHTFKTEITRVFQAGIGSTSTEYVDNISLTPQFPVSPPSVPEPSSFVLLGSGLLALAGTMRRRFTA